MYKIKSAAIFNSGKMAYGAIIYKDNQKWQEISGEHVLQQADLDQGILPTLWIAEYVGIIKALKYLIEAGASSKHIIVQTSVQDIARKFSKPNPVVTTANHRRVDAYLISMLSHFKKLRFEWEPREDNFAVSRLALKHVRDKRIEKLIQAFDNSQRIWELIHHNEGRETWRLRTIEGWALYVVERNDKGAITHTSMTYVPDETMGWHIDFDQL